MAVPSAARSDSALMATASAAAFAASRAARRPSSLMAFCTSLAASAAFLAAWE